MCTPNKLNGSTRSWAHNIFLTWALDSYFGRFWPKDLTVSLQPSYRFLLTLATIVLSSRLFSLPFNNLFSSPVSHIYSPKLVERIMITLMASGRGGPMLLLLNGRLVGNGVWWGWYWNWFPLWGGRCPVAASFKKSQGVRAMAFPSNHICRKWGLPNNFLAMN